MLLLALVVPAYAINYGEPDGDAHPYVGIMVAFDEAGTPQWRCSGSLISPRIFLTAGHCVYGAASVQVWFESTVEELRAVGYPLAGGTWGEPVAHPQYDDFASFPITYDVGFVRLVEDAPITEYGTLAEQGFLDDLATRRGTQDVSFTTVGYGLQSRKPRYESVITRYQATSDLINLRSHLTDGYNLMTTNNPGDDRGGNCSGDSGGPILYSDTDIIVAVNSFGMAPHCKGNDYAWRTDIEATLSFLAANNALP
ncbi:MAG TPA: S1 family peptidase [Herpetosiphonaceae bacterium]